MQAKQSISGRQAGQSSQAGIEGRAGCQSGKKSGQDDHADRQVGQCRQASK
jgi:hypothetical protein